MEPLAACDDKIAIVLVPENVTLPKKRLLRGGEACMSEGKGIPPLIKINALSPRKPRSRAEPLKVNSDVNSVASIAVQLALFHAGFQVVSEDRNSFYLLPCRVGTFSNRESLKVFNYRGCIQCPPGNLQPSLNQVSMFPPVKRRKC